MIERIQAYKASDGTVFASLDDVQRHDLAAMITDDGMLTAERVASTFVANRDKVLDILTTGPKALPKARKINGGTKKRPTVVAATVPEPSASN